MSTIARAQNRAETYLQLGARISIGRTREVLCAGTEQAPALGAGQPAKVAKVQWFPSGSAMVKSRDG